MRTSIRARIPPNFKRHRNYDTGYAWLGIKTTPRFREIAASLRSTVPDIDAIGEWEHLNQPHAGQGTQQVASGHKSDRLAYRSIRDQGNTHSYYSCTETLSRVRLAIAKGELKADEWCLFFADIVDALVFFADAVAMKEMIGDDAEQFTASAVIGTALVMSLDQFIAIFEHPGLLVSRVDLAAASDRIPVLVGPLSSFV